MQATSATYRPISDTGVLTTGTLIAIALLAALTLVAILYGMRLARRRRQAQRIEAERVETEASEQPPIADQPAPVLSPVPPVAPAPPPLDPGTTGAAQAPAAPDLVDEPVAAAAPPDVSQAVEAEPRPAPPPAATSMLPLTALKGLGPKVAARLAELGVATVADLAALDSAQAEALDARLGPFTGRMARDRWLEQARLLAGGDVTQFEAEFGKLDGG